MINVLVVCVILAVITVIVAARRPSDGTREKVAYAAAFVGFEMFAALLWVLATRT